MAYPMGSVRTQIPAPLYQPPTTPEEIAREKERISVLLEINGELLKYTTGLQVQGLGGPVGTQQPGESSADTKIASEDYKRCMRYLSCNIQYLTAAAAMPRNKQGTFAGPAIMDPPDCVPSLVEPYQRLRNLFPGWKGLAHASGGRYPGMGGMTPGQPPVQGQSSQYGNPMAMTSAPTG